MTFKDLDQNSALHNVDFSRLQIIATRQFRRGHGSNRNLPSFQPAIGLSDIDFSAIRLAVEQGHMTMATRRTDFAIDTLEEILAKDITP